MRHAHDGRGTNLLGAASLAIADRLRLATEEGARQGGSAPAALGACRFLDGDQRSCGIARLTPSRRARGRPAGGGWPGAASARPGRALGSGRADAAARGGAPRAPRPAGGARSRDGRLTDDEQAQLVRLHEKVLAALTDGRRSARRTAACAISTSAATRRTLSGHKRRERRRSRT